MADKITIGLDNQTQAGFNEIGKATDDITRKAEDAQQAYSKFVEEVLRAEQVQKTSAAAMAEQAAEAAEYRRVLNQVESSTEGANDGFVSMIAHLNNLKGLTNLSTQSIKSLITLLGGSLVPIAAAAAAFEAMALALDATGKSATDTESNLDSLTKQLGETSAALAGQAAEATNASQGWKNFDENVTAVTDGVVYLLKQIQAVATGVDTSMSESSAAILKLQERRKAATDLIAASDKSAADASAARLEAERVASLDRIDLIDKEIEAVKRETKELAEQDKLDDETKKKQTTRLDTLHKRRLTVIDEAAKKWKERQQEMERRDEQNWIEHVRKQEAQRKEEQRKEAEHQQKLLEIEKAAQQERTQMYIAQMEFQRQQEQKAAEARLEIIKKEIEARKELIEGKGEFGKGKSLVEEMVEGISAEDLVKQIAKQRSAAAGAAFDAAGFGETLRKGGVTSEAEIERRTEARRRKLMEDAAKSARRDAFQGKVDPQEVTNALDQLLGRMYAAIKKQGDLDIKTLEALRQAMQLFLEQQQKSINAENLLKQIQSALQGAAQRQRAQSSGYRR